MANVQIDDGNFTRIANEILENVAKAKLNGTQYAIVLTVWRHTYGYQKTEGEFSLGFLSKETGLDRMQIRRELAKLIERNIITVVKEGDFTHPQVLKFNKDYDKWVLAKTLTVSEKAKSTVSELANRGVSELANHIKKDNKKRIKENNPPIIPPKKPSKKKFGEFQNVKLTDDEYSRLCTDYGQATTDAAIKFLDEYIEEKGYKSKSHNLAIRRWVIDAVNKKILVNKSPPVKPIWDGVKM